MTSAARRWLFWTPRVLTILFAGFISIFAMDVFEGHHPLGQVLLALAMHLIPTGVVLVSLAIAWRWEWVGAVLYAGLGVVYVVWAWGRFSWDVYALIAGPLLLVGLLFLVGWRYRSELRGGD